MEEFYTVAQVSLILKVHPLTIRRYIKQNKLKAYRAGGNIRISAQDLKTFTQNFTPSEKHPKTSLPPFVSAEASHKSFSFSDPILSLRGKGLSLSKLEE